MKHWFKRLFQRADIPSFYLLNPSFWRLFLSKLWDGLIVIFGVIFVVFFLYYALPGDPVSMIAGQRTDIMTKEAIAAELGLNEPKYYQLYLYIRDLMPISLHEHSPEEQAKYNYKVLLTIGTQVVVLKVPYMRRSFQTKRLVTELIFEKLILTIILAFSAIIFASIVGILLGVGAATHQGTWVDNALVSLSIAGISLPSFVSASLISLYLGYKLGPYLGLNGTGSLWVDTVYYGTQLELRNLILPTITLGIRPLSIIAQLTRTAMLEVLSQDYIRTAYAKGVSRTRVIWQHALPNAINPVITAISNWMASLLSGAFFVELIFDWKGLGYETIQAVRTLDLPVLMGATIVIATMFFFINLLADLLHTYFDPRVRP